MKVSNLLGVILAASLITVSSAHAEKSTMEKAGDSMAETGKDIKNGAKKGARSVSDKGCELVNGKMECAGKKLKHKAQNLGDKIKD